MSINDDAERLIKLMKNHANNEVNNNAIQSIHREGYITENLGNNLYKECINKEIFTIEAREGLTLNVNDVVCILLYNGNASYMMIDFKKPKSWNKKIK